ncbi:MAG: hypothetical protein RL398_226 [Planctomycetota bacterium]
MEVFWIVVAVVAMTISKQVMDQRAKQRADHVRLLEQALNNPAVDRGLIETLTAQLTGQSPPKRSEPRPLRLLLGLGWITLFTGLGVMSIGGVLNENDALAGGILTALIGFALVTYPFVLRELAERERA